METNNANGSLEILSNLSSKIKDKYRTEMIKDKKVNFIFLDREFDPPFEKVTSVAVIPFTEGGMIVAAELERGIDLPGGHVLESERTIEEVAYREAMEEIFIKLGELFVVKVIQSDYFGSTPDKLTYMIITTSFVREILPFQESNECVRRHIMSPKEFIDKYAAGRKNDMKTLIDGAKKILNIS